MKEPEGLRLRETRFSGLMEPGLNCLVSVLIVTSGGNQVPLIACPTRRDTVRMEGKLNRAKPGLDDSGPQTGLKFHLPTEQ